VGTVPEELKLHHQMEKIFKQHRKIDLEGNNIDLGTAGALALGSLIIEENHVQIMGQDSQRRTFSHCHAVMKELASVRHNI